VKASSAKALLIGRAVLAGAAKGRSRALATIGERHALLVVMVVQMFNELSAKGFPLYGMAGRISRRLGGHPCERHVRRILSDMQGGKSEALAYSPPKIMRRTLR
jgi:hypothetical protein